MMTTQTNRIRALNDDLRQHLIGGGAVITPGIAALGREAIDRIVKTIDRTRYRRLLQHNRPEADMGGLTHGDQAPTLASRGDLHAKGNNCKHRPTAMKKNSRSYHQAAGDRANGGALQNVGEGS
jgi:hypothetical protein